MDALKMGDRMKHQEDGRVFLLTKITPDFLILKSLDGSTQILTGHAGVNRLFEKLPPSESAKVRSLPILAGEALAEIPGPETRA